MKVLFIILQVALEIFSRDPNLAAGNLCGYFPQDTVVSEAPKGYTPFYISHIARHGSRFIGGVETAFQVVDTLTLFADQGMLTADGLALLEDLRELQKMSEGRSGDLTGLGALEHRQICARMVSHYPEVFSDGKRTRAEAYSTQVPRVVASMNAFLSELSERAPGISVTANETKWGKGKNQEVAGYTVHSAQKKETEAAEKALYKIARDLRKGYNFRTFAARVFVAPGNISEATLNYVVRTAYKCLKVARVTEPDKLPGMGKYFTAGELYSLWTASSIYWIKNLDRPGYASPLIPTRGRGILDCIVNDADAAIASDSRSAATFRFSHDTYLLPLMAAIPLEGTVLDCKDEEVLEHFQDFNFVCPACNVQLIFYRNKRGSVLVKFLLNEKETLIHGLKPKTGCYYEWDAVKRWVAARK